MPQSLTSAGQLSSFKKMLFNHNFSQRLICNPCRMTFFATSHGDTGLAVITFWILSNSLTGQSQSIIADLTFLSVWTVDYIEEENFLCCWFCQVNPSSSKLESMLFCMWREVCLVQNIIFSLLNLCSDIYFVMWKLC